MLMVSLNRVTVVDGHLHFTLLILGKTDFLIICWVFLLAASSVLEIESD